MASIYKKKPFVSVIIPTYNAERFVKEAINSVLNQTYQNFEIIVIDDSSTDNTKNILEELHKKENRILYYSIPHSGRPSIPRNYGIKKSTGDLIAFLDADDFWTKQKLQIQVDVFEDHPDLIFIYSMSITYGQVNLFSPNYELLPLPFRAAKNWTDLIQIGNTIPLSSILIRSNILKETGGFDEDPELQVEDYDLWIRLSDKGEFKFIPRILVYYRVHELQFSADWETKKRRLEYMGKKRDLTLPKYKYYRNKNFLIMFLRNIIHFKFYLLYKLVGYFENHLPTKNF